MDTLTTEQICKRLAEHVNTVNHSTDVHEVRESRRAIKLYIAELKRRNAFCICTTHPHSGEGKCQREFCCCKSEGK